MPDHRAPRWMDHAVWWHVLPLTMTGAPPRLDPSAPVAHRLVRVEAWLDHAVELGASGIQMGPVFASASHGYDTLDHFRIDPRLGDDADFDHLVAQCHGRGLRLMLDGVFNHVSRAHPLVQRALAEGHGSAAADLVDLRRGPDGSWYPQVFEGHPDLVELNHDSPAVEDLAVSVMEHWCARGVDAWRMDAAYAVPPRFWAGVLARVREHFPDVLTVGEVIHGDYVRIVEESTLDSLTQYELWKAVWSSVRTANLFELDWALQRHDEFLDHFVPTTFISNHDVTRIATQVGTEGAAVAATVLMTVGGMPVVYHGDELAMTGLKEDRPGGDDAVRPEFPPAPPVPVGEAARMQRRYQDLIGLRRRHPWLVRARTAARSLDNGHAVWRSTGEGGEFLLTEVAVPAAGAPWARVFDEDGVLFDTRD